MHFPGNSLTECDSLPAWPEGRIGTVAWSPHKQWLMPKLMAAVAVLSEYYITNSIGGAHAALVDTSMIESAKNIVSPQKAVAEGFHSD